MAHPRLQRQQQMSGELLAGEDALLVVFAAALGTRLKQHKRKHDRTTIRHMRSGNEPQLAPAP